MKTETINRKSSKESNYTLIQRLILKADVTANEEEGTLSYENDLYVLNYKLTDLDFDLEFTIEGEAVELEEAELDLLFEAVNKEIENEIDNSRFDNSKHPSYDEGTRIIFS